MSDIYKSIRENDDLDLALNHALTKIRTAIEGRDDDLHILNLVTIDEKNIPIRHFGIILDWSDWKKLSQKLNQTKYIILLTKIMFAGVLIFHHTHLMLQEVLL